MRRWLKLSLLRLGSFFGGVLTWLPSPGQATRRTDDGLASTEGFLSIHAVLGYFADFLHVWLGCCCLCHLQLFLSFGSCKMDSFKPVQQQFEGPGAGTDRGSSACCLRVQVKASAQATQFHELRGQGCGPFSAAQNTLVVAKVKRRQTNLLVCEEILESKSIAIGARDANRISVAVETIQPSAKTTKQPAKQPAS